MLPSWVGAQKARTERVPISHSYEVADSALKVDTYRILGKATYTCVPPPGYVASPAVLKWMRTLDKSLVPIWRKQTYGKPLSPDTFMAIHLGLAKHVRRPRGPLRIARVEMPSNATFKTPNLIAMPFFENTSLPIVMHQGGPAPYVPLDMRQYLELRDGWDASKTVDQQLDAIFRRLDEALAREVAHIRSEYLYARADLNKFYEKQLRAPGDTLSAYRQYRAKRDAMALEAMRRMNLVVMRQGA